MKIKRTQRNFQFIDFVDHDGESCSLQQSSLALYQQPGSSAVWLGVDEHRMHLTDKQVMEILPHLQSWLDNGTFDL